jgi:hypothetical protein
MVVLAAYFAVGLPLIFVGPAARVRRREQLKWEWHPAALMDTENPYPLNRALHFCFSMRTLTSSDLYSQRDAREPATG